MAAEVAAQHESVSVEEVAEAGHAENSDEDDAEPDGSESSSEDHGDSQDVASKKKKKKKKKKKGTAAAAAAQPVVDPAARKEGERRLQEALEQLTHNSEDGMWIKLGGCHLADGKLKKLCDALKANTACISLDLSDNLLTDQGATALAAALADGRAPDLIELDLRDNPQIQRDGTAALEELQGRRKTLRVALGPSTPPPADQHAPADAQPRSPKAGGADAQQQQQQQQQQHANGGSSLADSVKSNPVISKYFAVGNDEAEDAEQAAAAGEGGAAGGDSQLGGLSAAELARILWDQLEEGLDAPRPDVPAVSEPLRALAEQVEHEMDGCALPMLPSTEVGELKTFTQWAVRKLHLLHSVLDLVPPPILTPYSKTQPVPAVGTHRAAAAELLAQMLRGCCAAIALPVAASGLLPRCAALAVRHPNCSPLHGAVARCLRLSLSKPLGPVGLWQQLLAPLPAAAEEGGAAAAELNLAAAVAGIAEAAAAAPTVGKRPQNMGFALAVAQTLHTAATGEELGAGSSSPGGQPGDDDEQQQGSPEPADGGAAGESASGSDASADRQAGSGGSDPAEQGGGWEAQLAERLSAADAWVSFAGGPSSLMRRLLAEHEGDLGGPRPRPSAAPLPEDEDGGGQGQVISGQELLMMLRGLNLGGGFSGM